MKDFDIRNYMWNVWEISNHNKLNNIRIALDMFIENLELGYERYGGASGVDYNSLSKIWRRQSESYHTHEKIIFNKVIHKSYTNLCDAWSSRNRAKFEEACWVNLMMFGIARTDPDRKI